MDIKIKVTVLVTYQDKILLIQEFLKKRDGYFWNIIKGTYGDVENESLIEAAMREAKEEAGVEVKITGFLDCLQVQKSDETKIQFNFIGEAATDSITMASEADQEKRSEGILKAGWFSIEQIEQMDKNSFADKHIFHVVEKYKNKQMTPIENVFYSR